VHRQGAPVVSAPGCPGGPIRRRRAFRIGFAGGLDLLDLLEGQLQLIFRESFGPAAKAVALQFLDDLAQPLVLGALGQVHRLQRVRIVREANTALASSARTASSHQQAWPAQSASTERSTGNPFRARI
jgi:hypothetical protein